MTATLEPGLRGPEAEALLAEHGLTLGHFPQSFEYATIGGFAATRSSGQSSAGYGRFDALVVGLTRRHPAGRAGARAAPRPTRPAPTCAQLFLGSEGALRRDHLGHRPRAAAAGRSGSTRAGAGRPSTPAPTRCAPLAQARLLPTVLRLSDETETAINLADPDAVGGERRPAAA